MEFVNENNNNLNNNQNNKENINELKNKIIKLEKDNNNLKNEINKLENNNKKYINEINELNNKLIKYENENKELKNKIINLNNLLNKENNKNISNNNQNNNKDKIIELMEKLNIKENEIKEIKSILPFDLKYGDKLMTIIFISVDQKIHYSLICKNTDKFSVIEQKLFEVFPQCQEENYYFMANGIQINRYKTLEQLKLKNSSIITMNKYEFE